MKTATAGIGRTPGELAAVHYLNQEYGVQAWLTTTDHKRIAILYLGTILFF